MTVTANQNRVAAFRAVSATESSSNRLVITAVLISLYLLERIRSGRDSAASGRLPREMPQR